MDAIRTHIIDQFTARCGYAPDLEHPRTFNEKLQWYKLHCHDPRMTTCADKYAVRGYVKERGAGDCLPWLYGVYESVDQIRLEDLPDRFVLKTTHASGQNVFCTDKNKMDWPAARARLAEWVKPERNHYWAGHEWCYKDIPPRIVAEEYLGDALPDYKVFCFNGNPRFLGLYSGRQAGRVRADFFDPGWHKLPFTLYYPASGIDWPRPKSLDRMLSVAGRLAEPFPFVRVDLYEVDGRPIFGEMTFYPGNGMEPFDPPCWNVRLGEWFRLPDQSCEPDQSEESR